MKTNTQPIEDRRGYAGLDRIFHPSVIEAVAVQMSRTQRPYSEHWSFYVHAENKAAFSNNLAVFISCCHERRQWLVGR